MATTQLYIVFSLNQQLNSKLFHNHLLMRNFYQLQITKYGPRFVLYSGLVLCGGSLVLFGWAKTMDLICMIFLVFNYTKNPWVVNLLSLHCSYSWTCIDMYSSQIQHLSNRLISWARIRLVNMLSNVIDSQDEMVLKVNCEKIYL